MKNLNYYWIVLSSGIIYRHGHASMIQTFLRILIMSPPSIWNNKKTTQSNIEVMFDEMIVVAAVDGNFQLFRLVFLNISSNSSPLGQQTKYQTPPSKKDWLDPFTWLKRTFTLFLFWSSAKMIMLLLFKDRVLWSSRSVLNLFKPFLETAVIFLQRPIHHHKLPSRCWRLLLGTDGFELFRDSASPKWV